jgi:hypothetical protein
MSTRSKRTTGTYGSGAGADLGDDDPTVIDGAQFADEVTPVELPRCTECGRVVFFDDFTQAASAVAMGLFNADRCVRGRKGNWWWCGERWRVVFAPPR